MTRTLAQRQEDAAKGGRATVRKYGVAHMRANGRKSAALRKTGDRTIPGVHELLQTERGRRMAAEIARAVGQAPEVAFPELRGRGGRQTSPASQDGAR